MLYVPTVQATQAVVAFSEYEPASHAMHACVGEGLTLPGPQKRHAVAPGVEEKRPGLHGAHAVALGRAAKVPGLQGEQAEDTGVLVYVPTAQTVQGREILLLDDPALHSMHAVELGAA